jgi:predicted RNA binding protein YcfA (HicA-like mRNA interferase family)
MSKLPVVKASRLEKILLQLGFKRIRQKGGHVFYRHPDGRYTAIPDHPGKDIPRELIRTILKQVNLPVEEFLRLLNET